MQAGWRRAAGRVITVYGGVLSPQNIGLRNTLKPAPFLVFRACFSQRSNNKRSGDFWLPLPVAFATRVHHLSTEGYFAPQTQAWLINCISTALPRTLC